jgi:hypothetical protein
MLGTLLVWWFLRNAPAESVEPPQITPLPESVRASTPTSPAPSMSVRAGEPLPRESANRAPHRTIEVRSTDGRPIERAEIFLTAHIGPTVRKTDRQALGHTNADGQLLVDTESWSLPPSSFVAARAKGYLPSYVSLQAAGDDPVRLVLAPELRQRFRCVDLQGDPVPGVAVMLSRKGIPWDFGVDGLDSEEESGFDPIDATLTGESDELGLVEIGELRGGAYRLSIRSEYYDRVVPDGASSNIEISESTHEILLSPLLCAIVQVVGDEMYTHAVTTSAKLWLNPSTDRRSTHYLYLRLAARYPGALVYVNAVPSATSTVTSVSAELWLARTGKRVLDLQLLPAYSDPKPLVIQVDPGSTGADNLSNVVFTIRDAAGRLVDCPHMQIYREKSVIPLMKEIVPSKPLRLPFGRWQLATQYSLLEGYFQPKYVDISTPEASFEIQLEIELVPVRVLAIGHRGQPENHGNLVFTQFGRTENSSGPLDRKTHWLRPGNTEWYFGTDQFYESVERMIPVRSMPDGEVQTIQFDLVLNKGL